MSFPVKALREAAALLSDASKVAVLSGAGLSRASGIPTYRDADGLWRSEQNRALSHIEGYRQDPAAFHRFWDARMAQVRAAKPNAGHMALRCLQAGGTDVCLITQNVDGLLQQVGCQDVIELHGNLRRQRCGTCARRSGWALFGRCLSCGSRMRPDVVLFGEVLDDEVYMRAVEAVRRAGVLLVVGTSALVNPAAELPALAMRWGAKLLVLDVERSLLAEAAHVFLQGPAEMLLPELVERVALLRQ